MSVSPAVVGQVTESLRGFYDASLEEPDALHLIADFGSTTAGLSEANPELTDRIQALNLAMRSADTVRRTWPSAFPDIVGVLFINVEDAYARRFLGDVVLARVSRDEGRAMNGKAPRHEQHAMIREMGLEDAADANDMELGAVVTEVMEGRLQLTPQT